MKRILHIGLGIGRAIEPFGVRGVFSEQPLARLTAHQLVASKTIQFWCLQALAHQGDGTPLTGGIAIAPIPLIAQPQGGQQGELCSLRPTIHHLDSDQQILRSGLGVINKNIKITLLCKDPRVHQLIFRLLTAAPLILFKQLAIREFLLGIFVQPPHEAVGWRVQQMIKIILDVFTVIPLSIGQAKGAFFENGITAIPKG